MMQPCSRTVGVDDVQRGQLSRLLEVMNRPDISVQMLPLEAGDMASMPGLFVMFSSGREPPSVLSS